MTKSSYTKSPRPDPDDVLLGLPTLPGVLLAERKRSPVYLRIVTPRDEDDDQRLAFQHTVFCQTSLPYRDPGDDVRLWQRRQGRAFLEVQAGRIFNPAIMNTIEVGLPWGTKPRLILAHLNAEALRKKSSVVEVEGSLSAFVRRVRGFNHGREFRNFKEQLSRLSAATIRLAIARDKTSGIQINTQIITAMDLWLQKDERQRVLWPSTIKLSLEYFNSLQEHAVPLHEADLAALAHSAMALDIYVWLAQRLHRIKANQPTTISWEALKAQFGPDFSRMRAFKPFFRRTLIAVCARYQTARVELDDETGLTAYNSPSPVAKRLMMLSFKANT